MASLLSDDTGSIHAVSTANLLDCGAGVYSVAYSNVRGEYQNGLLMVCLFRLTIEEAEDIRLILNLRMSQMSSRNFHNKRNFYDFRIRYDQIPSKSNPICRNNRPKINAKTISMVRSCRFIQAVNRDKPLCVLCGRKNERIRGIKSNDCAIRM